MEGSYQLGKRFKNILLVSELIKVLFVASKSILTGLSQGKKKEKTSLFLKRQWGFSEVGGGTAGPQAWEGGIRASFREFARAAARSCCF